MAEKVYNESNYRFTDPIRFFKQNDPYYFEVDNIPLKQLQENCLWLKDQINHASTTQLVNVKRSDIEELRPYALGADRLVRVKPGRYTARINDASTREPLAYLQKVMGEAIGDVDAWVSKFPDGPSDEGAILKTTLDKFKSTLAQDALGMNGLVERAFTWPVVDSDRPVNYTGVKADSTKSWLSYAKEDGGIWANSPGTNAYFSPFVISEAITWARAQETLDFLSDQGYENLDDLALPSFEITNPNSGWAKFPFTESFFIKAWRGVSRLSIVDIDEELSIEVPQFDPDDFSYTDENGNTTSVAGVSNRIDLVFIYSKPIDASAVNTIQNGTVTKITKPTLGIVKGAGIKSNYSDPGGAASINLMNKVPTGDSIHAAPGDQSNEQMGFTSTAENDISVSIRGSFPSPDDLMNLAPLISEKLEDNAYELIGQSILPVAYVFVQGDSQVVLSTDVVDIRPLFRTAELTYNERAGIGAAFPQLSLANPAVGKGQLDYELRRVYEDLKKVQLDNSSQKMSVLATGYVFGGWNFGPEGALYDFYQNQFAGDTSDTNDSIAYIKDYIKTKYSVGSGGATITVPDYPDWDLAQWCVEQDLDNKGYYPNDYINTFISTGSLVDDASIVGGSYKDGILPDGTKIGGGTPERLKVFNNTQTPPGPSNVNFHYISKKIKFNRPTWLVDYEVDTSLVNCLAQCGPGIGGTATLNASYFGYWVEKGFDEFTIYVAFTPDTNVPYSGSTQTLARFPAPHTVNDKLTGSQTVSARDGGRFSAFVVLVSDMLYSNTNPISTEVGKGYVGNPRVGKCTYPTVMWKLTGIPQDDAGFLYGNLNGTNPTIAVKN